MSSLASNLCSKCRKPAFQPRVNVNSAELYTKLRSEFGPAVFNSQDFEEMLRLSDRDLDDYDAEVVRLQSQILYIEAQKERLKDHRARLRSLLSPIRQLPNETLGRIFDYACESNLLQEYPWSKDCASQPPNSLFDEVLRHIPTLSLGTVCARWRSLVLSSSGLWSRLNLEISADYTTLTSECDGFISTLELFLARSGKSPLMLRMNIRDQPQSSDPLALFLVSRHSLRWKSFHYTGTHRLSNFKSLSQESHHFLILDDLQFHVTEDADDLDLFERAPKLRYLEIVIDDSEVTPSKLPWRQLTSLHLCVLPDYGDISAIMDECPNLKDVHLSTSDFSLSQPFNYITRPPRVADKIESLLLQCECPEEQNTGLMEGVLSSYTLPSLVELHLAYESTGNLDPPPWPQKIFTAFMKRSSCSLTSFRVHNIAISDSNLVAALQSLPSLLDLSIDDCNLETSPITEDFISSLRGSGQDVLSRSGSSLVPKLRSLSLNFAGEEFDDELFIGLVSSRWLPDPAYAAIIGIDCLRSVKVDFINREVDEEVYKPLYYLEKMGLRVVLTSQYLDI